MRPRLVRAAAVLLGALFMLAGPFAGNAAAQSCDGRIGGIVFLDANGDLLRQAAEDGVNGVVLRITGPSGSVQTVTSGGGVSDIAGHYATGLLCDEGSYTVEIVSVPTGYVVAGPSVQSVTLTRDPSTGVLSKKGNLNFALALAPCTSSIGDYVWNDLNANGVQDAGEPPLSGVVVNLRGLAGDLLQSTTTDGNGLYNFVVPCSQTYVVEAVTPTGFTPTQSLQGGDPTTDSNGSPTQVTIGADENRRDVDFGFYALCQGVIGNFVWHDLNRDGVQDAGEPGLYNVKIELLQDGVVVRTAYTDTNGYFEFTGICPGTYQVRYDATTVASGFQPTLTGQGTSETDSNPNSSTVTLASFSSSDLTIDFGFQVPCSGILGDFVWEDRNANGVQDAGEPGIPNVEVRLYREGESTPAQVVVTNANGYYQFTGLCGGNFVVEVNPNTLPPAFAASPANQGSNDATDSDGVNHRAGVSLPADNSSNLTIDFGYYRKTLIQIVKRTNGTDNNTPTGPTVTVGDVVTWTYLVTNTGSTEPLRDVAVVDDNGTPDNTADDFAPTFVDGDTNNNGLLDVGETWSYVATGIATAGQYVNWATATGTGNLSGTPAGPARDPDHYLGSTPTPDGKGRFTGGGKLIASGDFKVTYGLTIHCDRLLSNNLEVNWGTGRNANQFHMTEHVVTVACTDNPAIGQPPPAAPLDTMIGIGTGRYNNVDGYTIQFTLVDYGEPGSNDRISLRVFETANPSNVVLDVPLQGVVGGNLQAHYDQPHK